MNNTKLFITLSCVTCVLMLIFADVYAGDVARVGTASGEQVLIPVGARGLAMGGADLAYTSGVDAIFYNPAGLAMISSGASVQFSTLSIFNDVRVNYLALGIKAGGIGTIGLNVKAFSFGDIPLTTVQDMDGESGQTFSPAFTSLGLTYARSFTDAINFGITAKLIYESIPRASATAFAVDVGVQYQTEVPGLGFGLAVKNLGTDIQYGGSAFLGQAVDVDGQFTDFRSKPTASHALPASLEMGVSFKRAVVEDNNVILSGIFQHNNLTLDNYKMGVEYGYKDLVFVRGGYLYTPDLASEEQLFSFSLGVGGHLNLNGMDIVIDYAYRDVQYFDGENLFTLRFGF